MKITYKLVLLFAAISSFIACKKEEVKDIDRPETPGELTVSKGDTSVFLAWQPVSSATSYLIVRGLDVIASGLTEPRYEDAFGPDTTVQYRVYSVNGAGWRSYRYASDSGYVAIPAGILPRPPQVTATTNDFRHVALTISEGRFALSYNIERDGELIAENIVGNTYIDTKAPTANAVYRIFSVNNNGTSLQATEAVGRKAYVYNGDFEGTNAGTIIAPWTFVANNIGYYTEGSPVVEDGIGINGSKGLKIAGGKIQLLYDWGGVAETGKYKFHVWTKKASGGFWMVPDFSGAEHVSANGEWTEYSITTGIIQKGGKFNVKVEPYDNGSPAYIDNVTIEYINP